MVEAYLRRFLENPRRGTIVIILTCGLGLVAGGPAADDYFAMRGQRTQLVSQLEQAREEAGQLPHLQQLASRRAGTLRELDNRAVTEEGIHEFRSELAEMIRGSGCRLRRIDLETARRRKWRDEDHPWEAPAASKTARETPYTLRSQRITLSVSGPLLNVNELLGRLHETGKMMHTKSFSLRPAGEQRTEVLLDLELIVFDLEKPPQDTAS